MLGVALMLAVAVIYGSSELLKALGVDCDVQAVSVKIRINEIFRIR